jgi:hypothetical protein
MKIDRVTNYYAQSIAKPDMVDAKVTYTMVTGGVGWVWFEMAGIHQRLFA